MFSIWKLPAQLTVLTVVYALLSLGLRVLSAHGDTPVSRCEHLAALVPFLGLSFAHTFIRDDFLLPITGGHSDYITWWEPVRVNVCEFHFRLSRGLPR